MRIALIAAFLLTTWTHAHADTVKFHSGAKCSKPAGFNLGEWKKLKYMVERIEKIDRRNNVGSLKMSRDDFKAGKRYVVVEFDCASLTHLKKHGDKGRKPEIVGLLGNDAVDPALVANQNDIREEFKKGVKKLVMASHASKKERDMRVTLKKGVLRVSRTTFRSGGWTPGEWNKFLENNL